MSDRLENLGLLGEKKTHEQILRLKLKGLREQLHRGNNPYKPLADTDGDALLVATREMAAGLDDWRRLCGEIKRLCADLGEPAPSFE